MASFALADFAPVSGRLHVGATADWGQANQHQTDLPQDVVLGSDYGVFSHHAQATAGATASVTVQTSRSTNSLLLSVDGAYHTGGQSQLAQVYGDFKEVFNLTAPAQVELTCNHGGDSHTNYGFVLFSGSQVFARDTLHAILDLPADQYTLQSQNMFSLVSGSVNVVVIESLSLTIVPEPSSVLTCGLGVAGLSMRRRGRGCR